MLTFPQDWIFGLINFSTNVSFASLPLFLPTIIVDLGVFDTLQSNGLSAPPYLLCFIVMIITTFLSDRVALRGPFACSFALVASVGYLILANTSDVAPRYAGIFLVVLIFTTVAIVLVWNANSNENESKRAGGVWIVSSMSQLIVGFWLTLVLRSKPLVNVALFWARTCSPTPMLLTIGEACGLGSRSRCLQQSDVLH